MLDSVKVVLVNTSHPGNMGSAARAMKTMGLSELVLVDPVSPPDGKSSAMAAGAGDVLANARVCDSLEAAIADCSLVIGTSARSRTLSWPMLDPRSCGEKIVAESHRCRSALVFGRENSGLTNDELQLCHYHVNIDANPEYSSLNLAAAVQLLSYEVRMAWLQADSAPVQASDYPLSTDLERFYQHLEAALKRTGFIVPQHPGNVMSKLRRLFNRARPESQELKILRGILSSVDRVAKQAAATHPKTAAEHSHPPLK